MLQRFIFTTISLLLFGCAAWHVYWALTGGQHQANIIVLTVESLRSDMVSREKMPNLADIAEGGFSFKHHRAVSGWTGTNIVSLLTGLSPFESGVHTRGQSLDSNRSTPLEDLRNRGYSVEGVQGFMTMDIYKNLGLDIAPQVDDPLYRLAENIRGRKQFFLWYHYVHTHLPYTAPDGYETWTSQTLLAGAFPDDLKNRLVKVQQKSSIHFNEETYSLDDTPHIHEMQSSTIAKFDDWFGNFWDFFLGSGLFRNTILVLTADHGDEHGERGLVGHASTTQLGHLHEEIVRVPLFIWLPQNFNKNSVAPEPHLQSTHLDIMPTLLELLHIEPNRQLTGRNLFTETKDSVWEAMTSSGGFAEEDPAHIRYFDYGTIHDDWKLLLRIRSNGKKTARLYNLAHDPEERVNLAGEKNSITEFLTSRLRPLIESRTVHDPAANNGATALTRKGCKPQWLYPAAKGRYGYDDMNGIFKLAWSGSQGSTYQLEYSAGSGPTRLSGTLKVDGNAKDFGKISRRYWQTWIVPNSPVRVRVRDETSSSWSDWLELEAKP